VTVAARRRGHRRSTPEGEIAARIAAQTFATNHTRPGEGVTPDRTPGSKQSMGKKYTEVRSKVDREKRYSLSEGCELVKQVSFVKFDESVDCAARLGVNPKHADQMIRSSVALPHGTGKSVRVLVFAKGDRAAQATEAGADF